MSNTYFAFARLGAMELPVPHKPSISISNHILLSLPPNFLCKIPSFRSSSPFPTQKLTNAPLHFSSSTLFSGLRANAQSTGLGPTQVEEGQVEVQEFDDSSMKSRELGGTPVDKEADVQVYDGYTITQFCDKMIDLFLNEKTRSKEWRRYLIFREEWKKYGDRFYNRCRVRAETEADPVLKEKISSLGRKVKKIDEEMEVHTELLKEIQDHPTDINAIVTRRRKDFSGQFFRHLTLLSETCDNLEDKDAMARLGTRCLSAVSAYDNTLGIIDTFDTAQAKFNDILNSPSLDAACDKIKSLAKAKELDSSLILLINSAWASAKESTTMQNEVKEIMYKLYKTTKSSLRSIAPKEIKLLKYLLNIADPEERFSAMATAFCPGDSHESKDPDALYTTPKELHKWVKIMLDAYNLNIEDTEMREVKQMAAPIVIQRLFILKETIEEEYLEKASKTDTTDPESEEL